MKNVEKMYARWEKLLNQAGDADEIEWTSKEIINSLKSIGWDLDDLSETISIVESNPARFKLSPAEVSTRKRFVSATQSRVTEIRTELTSSDAKSKAAGAKRSALMAGGSGPSSRYAKLEKEAEARNDEFIEDQSQKQELIMREQDTQLAEVSSTVGVLKDMGSRINNELEDQNRLLDELDLEMETTSERLKRTIQRVDKVLAISRDGKQSCMICLLLMVLFILIIVYVS